jgi:hypothetical protein
MSDYNTVASDEAIKQTIETLKANGFEAEVVENGAAAKDAVLALLPKGAEVFTNTSKTVDEIGLSAAINDSGDYDSIRNKLNAMWGDESKKREQRKLGAAPDYMVGSVHALTQEGTALIASNTGSQLPGYLYGAGRVIWVVGANKIVKNMQEAHARLQEQVLPLENERSKQAYGTPTNISKLVEYTREINPGRVHVVIVKEALGF